MVELLTDFAFGFDRIGPAQRCGITRAAPVRSDLFGVLVGGVHGVCPTDRVVVEGGRAAHFVQYLRDAVEGHQLVEGAIQAALGAGAVIAGDVDEQGVVIDAHVFEGLDQAHHLGVGVLGKAGIDLHHAGIDRLLSLVQVSPGFDSLRTSGQFGILWHDALGLHIGQGLFTHRIPAFVEFALVLFDPLLPNVMRGVGGAERTVQEEGLVRRHGMQAADPGDGLVDHVFRDMVTFFCRGGGFDRGGTHEQGGRPLVGFATHKAVELFKAIAGRPAVERTRHADLPGRGLVHLAHRARIVAVQAQHLGHRGHGVRAYAVVAGCPRRDFRDGPHPSRVVVAPRQQRLARRRTQCRGVEAVVEQAVVVDLLHGRHIARPPGHAWRAKAHVVDQDDDHVGCALRWAQRFNRWKLGVARIQRHLAL